MKIEILKYFRNIAKVLLLGNNSSNRRHLSFFYLHFEEKSYESLFSKKIHAYILEIIGQKTTEDQERLEKSTHEVEGKEGDYLQCFSPFFK